MTLVLVAGRLRWGAAPFSMQGSNSLCHTASQHETDSVMAPVAAAVNWGGEPTGSGGHSSNA